MKDELLSRISDFLRTAQYVATVLEPRLIPPFSDDMKAMREDAKKLLKDLAAER